MASLTLRRLLLSGLLAIAAITPAAALAPGTSSVTPSAEGRGVRTGAERSASPASETPVAKAMGGCGGTLG